MKKNTKLAYAVLGIVFILFNVIAFAVPTDKTTAFWIAYAFTVVAFALQVGIWNAAFKVTETLKSKFLGVPIIYVGRFFIEGLRVDQLLIGHTGIAVTQVVCLCIFVGGLIGLVLGHRKSKAC